MLDVTSEKHQRKERLMIMNIRGAKFWLLMFFYFLVFLLFIGYEVCFVVLHGVSAPKSRIGDGVLLLGFSFMLKMKMVQDGWRCTWWWRKIKTRRCKKLS